MILNVNIGVLGHVDSGKTSLSKALSTLASTASFDKNPQSQERGITLDLGFSAFTVTFTDSPSSPTSGGRELPTSLAERWGRPEALQFTLVDCPGHASLIRTVIGGAQIIDAVMLVVDAAKGIQTQTAECLVLAEIVCPSLILVINKVDLFPEADRERSVDRLTKRLHKTLEGTRFAGCPVAAVAACPAAPSGDDATSAATAAAAAPAVGLQRLIELLVATVPVPRRSPDGPTLFAVDHCFGIRGQGTVLTGTLLSGCVRVGDTVEVAHEQRRVKGMQVFRKPVDYAKQGDRLGLCVTQLDPKLLERGLVYSPGSVPTIHALVMRVRPVGHYKLPVRSKAKLHASIGHDTAMASLLLFRAPQPDEPLPGQYCEYVEEADMRACPAGLHALLEFERPVQAPPNTVVIVSKLDVDINQNVCRVAMHGRPLATFVADDYRTAQLPQLLRVYRPKCRRGRLDRVKDQYTIVVTGLFRKETALDAFLGLQVSLSTGQLGRIEGSFGQSGKCTVRMAQPLADDFCQKYGGGGGKRKGGGGGGGGQAEPVEVCLNFKRLLFDPQRKMTQA